MGTVLVQSLRSESAKARKEHYAFFSWDLANFCEHVSPTLLWGGRGEGYFHFA